MKTNQIILIIICLYVEAVLVFTKRDLRVIIIGTLIGGVVQYACLTYVRNNPEMFEELDDAEFVKEVEKELAKELEKGGPETRHPFKRIRKILPRGGAFTDKIMQRLLLMIAKRVVKRLAKNGIIDAFLGIVGAQIVNKTPKTKALNKVLRYAGRVLEDGTPVRFSHWYEKLYLLEPDPLSGCDAGWTFILNMLNQNLPYSYRQKKVKVFFRQQLTFQTKADIVKFMTCIVGLCVIFFAANDMSSILIVMESLLDALKRGLISKRLARRIVRALMREKIMIDPELLEAVAD